MLCRRPRLRRSGVSQTKLTPEMPGRFTSDDQLHSQTVPSPQNDLKLAIALSRVLHDDSHARLASPSSVLHHVTIELRLKVVPVVALGPLILWLGSTDIGVTSRQRVRVRGSIFIGWPLDDGCPGTAWSALSARRTGTECFRNG